MSAGASHTRVARPPRAHIVSCLSGHGDDMKTAATEHALHPAGESDGGAGAVSELMTALAHVESACNAIVAQVLDLRTESAARSEGASQRIAEVEATTAAAIERINVQHDLEIADLRALVQRL